MVFIEKTEFRRVIAAVCLVMADVFLLYPFLHEIGHALTGGLLGGEVVSITVYPSFCTQCDIRPDQLACYILTAISGILFPLACSCALPSRRSWSFLTALSLRVMALSSAVGEMIGVTRCILGSVRERSDLSVLIYETKLDPYAVLVLAGVLFILTALMLAAMEQIERMAEAALRLWPTPPDDEWARPTNARRYP